MATKKTKQCYFCATNAVIIDYKDTEMLKRMVTPQAQITKRRKNGACALHQRKLAEAIKRARFLGLVPYVSR